MDEAFRQKVESAAQGRQLKYIRLHKPEGTSLGFRYEWLGEGGMSTYPP